MEVGFMKDQVSPLTGKVILVTGGTGSFGHEFVRTCLDHHQPKKVIIFSRDELKQYEMRRAFPEREYPNLRFFIGDIRDRERLYRALDGVDIVVHAAALKQVPACEYNPIEAIRTNVLGATNLVDAAIDRGVKRVLALSTDKAANPVNLYGATKLCSDKLFIAGNNYTGEHETRFSVVRYGNVLGSRGSVVPFFASARAQGCLPITDVRMTRFIITLKQGVDFVIKNIARMKGGEIFVPKIPSVGILDIAKAVAPDCEVNIVGIRPGEKLHEVMVPADDARRTVEFSDRFVIFPDSADVRQHARAAGAKACPEGFEYASNNNTFWLDDRELSRLIDAKYLPDAGRQVGVNLAGRAVASPSV
jgi:UDP-N-acetylglucosamine 4,6-dehydratase